MRVDSSFFNTVLRRILYIYFFQISEEFNLKEQLHAAQLAKAKIEKAELNADFNKERLLLQKELLESKKDLEVMLQKEDNMKEQIELYAGT